MCVCVVCVGTCACVCVCVCGVCVWAYVCLCVVDVGMNVLLSPPSPCHAEVAISAPGGDNQPGTVFIYSGTGNTLLPVLSQTILGSQLNLLSPMLDGLTSFGSFVDGGTDIDGNYYNGMDCVVVCVLIRTICSECIARGYQHVCSSIGNS